MKKWKEKSWWIIIMTMFLLFALQITTLQEVYHHEKHLLSNEILASLKSNLHVYYVFAINRQFKTSTNYEKNTVRIIRNNIDTTFHFPNAPDWLSTEGQAIYDIRDTNRWSCKELASTCKDKMHEEYPDIPFSFTRTDSSGKVIDQYKHGHFRFHIKNTLEPIQLGLLDKHYLKVAFVLPLSILWYLAWERIITSFVLIVLLIFCSITLFIRLRNEKRMEANRKKFTHALVHNLRTPILTVKRSLELLQMALPDQLSPDQSQELEHCQDRTGKTLTDIENLLALSVNLNGLKLYKREENLPEMLHKLAEEYRMISPDKEVTITIDNRTSHPDFCYDWLHLYGALGNLLGNSVKYSAEKVNIQIVCSENQDKLVLSVRDNGFGILPAEQKFVFGEHNRGKRFENDREHKGYGLGLSYVYAVVKAHKGSIRLESDGEHGSAFIIEIPQRKRA